MRKPKAAQVSPTTIGIFCFLVLCIASATWAKRSFTGVVKDETGSPQTQARTDQPNTLEAYARKAKAKGETKVQISTPIHEYATVSGLEEARTYSRIAEVKLVTAKSYVIGPRTILTWYKFKILEDLSRGSYFCFKCAAFSDPPPDMLPVKSDEILVPKAGGSVTIDGVEITSEELDFPQFSKSQTYLLFFGLDESRRLAMMTMGPQGVFVIDEAGRLAGVNQQDSFLKRELKDNHKNLFGELKKHLKPK
jgi:hypothetical protein